MDARLVGCGVLPPAVLQALTLWKGDMISNGELLELVKKDLEFEKNVNEVEQNTDKLNEDSAFWGRFAFGERWAEKRARIAASSPDANKIGWDLTGIIVKSNDDLRQEAFIMQLIELCQEAFQEAGLELWLLPYRILSTGRTTGIIEMVRNSMSFDALKKRPGYGQGGLREHLQRMTQYAADPSEAFKTAQRNFVRSLAAYSLLSYLFLFKDRHNGNLLLDTAGHVIHIDFGFVFGVAPGGSFSLEMSTPFKLTEEMIDVMDGLRSSLFSEFVTLFCCGFLALQAHTTTFMTLVEVTCRGSTFKCFEGRDSTEIVGKLQERFAPQKDKEETIALVLDIIKESIGSYGTKQYDYFQYLSQGIAT
jgi:phosphatidylinositol 4-kinase B